LFAKKSWGCSTAPTYLDSGVIGDEEGRLDFTVTMAVSMMQ
jgi:hypothetical protein